MAAKSNLYSFIKYLIYLLLAVDAYQYFLSDFETSRHVFSEGISYTGFVESFAITIDVTSWLVLLLCFEVETAWLPAEKIEGWVAWLLYLILLGGAVFWGFKGEFLDFWDSFLWLAAFALIDLNVFGLTEGETQPLSP